MWAERGAQISSFIYIFKLVFQYVVFAQLDEDLLEDRCTVLIGCVGLG